MSDRILLVTPRLVRRDVFRSLDFEFEDFIAAIDEATWYLPEFRFKRPIVQQYAEGLSRRTLKFSWNPAYRLPRIDRNYDLLYAHCAFLWDLQVIARMPDWSHRVSKSIIHLSELFLSQLEEHSKYFEILKRFDLILTTNTSVLSEAEKMIGVKTACCPLGTNAINSAVEPGSFHRPIELFSLGRMNPKFFKASQKLMKEQGWTYLYDAYKLAANQEYRVNRKFVTDTLKRVLFFETNPGKIGCEVETRGKHEIGYRYFEGMGAGCICIGQVNKNPSFHEFFPWEDAVIELPEESEDMVPFLLDLNRDRDRLMHASRRNIHGMLSHYDFSHRWEFTLRQAGLEPSKKLLERKELLAQTAEKFR